MSQPLPPLQPPWPGGPRADACCELAAGGDRCGCAADFAEVLAAFASPLVLVHDSGAWRWER